MLSRYAGIDGDEAAFAMSISAGGYVRSVAHELGQDLAVERILQQFAANASRGVYLADTHDAREVEQLTGDERGWRRCASIRGVCFTEMPSVTGTICAWAGFATARRPICRSFLRRRW